MAQVPGDFQKMNEEVDVPMQLDVSPWLQNTPPASGAGASYELYAAISHVGEKRDSGHYLAYVLREDAWWTCNDASVKLSDLTHLENVLRRMAV
eukprot:3936741-Rhodomonas_salina.1